MMKNRSLRKKILFGICMFIITDIITLTGWYFIKITPSIKNYTLFKEKIISELNETYDNFEQLEDDLSKLSNSYKVSINLYNSKNKLVYGKELLEKNVFLFSTLISCKEELYMVTVSLDLNESFLKIILHLIIFQILVVFLLMIISSLFIKSKVINPVSIIIQNIRNYKFGFKPKTIIVKNEFDLIQNEFTKLVDSIEEEKKEQDRIIASISHDIKTPLTSIIGYSELIKNNSFSKEEILSYNDKIYHKAGHLKNIVTSFDDYLIHHSNAKLRIDNILIKDLVNELINDYKIELNNKNIEFDIKTNIGDNFIKIDIVKMKRVFSNIISNSIRYLRDDGKIKIIISKKENFYVITIADNGVGVDEKIVNKIFEPLFTTDYSRKNSGLGLSICKEFIEMHGGHIKAFNNNGLTIEIKLPI